MGEPPAPTPSPPQRQPPVPSSPPSAATPAKQGTPVPPLYIAGAAAGVLVLIAALLLVPGLLQGQPGGDAGMPTVSVTPTVLPTPAASLNPKGTVTSPPASVSTPGPSAPGTTPRASSSASIRSQPVYIMGDVIQGMNGGQLYVVLTNVWDINYWDGRYELYKVHRSDDGRMYLANKDEWGVDHILYLAATEAETNYTKVGYTPIGQVMVM